MHEFGKVRHKIKMIAFEVKRSTVKVTAGPK